MAIPKLQLLSRTQYDTDGTSTVWDFNFSGGYILPEHVKAYYDSPEGVRTVVNGTLIGEYQLQITPAIPANNVLTIYRDTPKDNPMVDFVDRGQISEVALDTVARQAIFVAAEASDDTVTANSDVAVNAAEQALARAADAAASAVAAGASADAAAVSVVAANGVLTSFRSVWLGSATADPTVDDNGNALIAGAVYLNTTINLLRVYDGANWQTSYASTPQLVTQTGLTGAMNVPVGTTAQRPTGTFGQQRANSTLGQMEWHNGTAWGPVGETGRAAAGANSDITSLAGLTSPVRQVRQLQPIGAAVSSNAMTLSAGALALEFRSATLTSGLSDFVQGTPANLVIPAGAALGTFSSQQSTLVLIALNVGGVIELAVTNLNGGLALTEAGLASTTAISASANTANVIYSTTARTNVPFRVLGLIVSQQGVAGQWASPPSLVQGSGGQAVTAMSSLGYGQTWKNVTGSRSNATNYYNTTGKPICIQLVQAVSGASDYFNVIINGVTVGLMWNVGVSGVSFGSGFMIIPPGAVYSVTSSYGSGRQWYELS
jgi:hypothetical protein